MPAAGAIAPSEDGLDQPFWDGLAAGDLKIQKCVSCGAWVWAPQWRCPYCGGWEMRWDAVQPEGVIYSWTRTWHPFAPELASVVPYVVALVELPQAGGARLMGTIVGPSDQIRIGALVSGEIQPPNDLTSGLAVMRWRLANEGADQRRVS